MGLDLDFRDFWDTTHASIPGGWSEDTEFTDRYVDGGASGFTGATSGKGADTDANAEHNHATVNHTHTGIIHYHFNSGAATSGGQLALGRTGSFGDPTKVTKTHPHTQSQTGGTVITYQNAALGNTSSDAQKPPSVRMIVIKPDDGNQEFPDGAFAFTNETSAPTGCTITGSDGQNDWDGKFIIGPESNGANGGGTLGSAEHNHTISGTHTHPIDSHGHSDANSGGDPSPPGEFQPSDVLSEKYAGHHKVPVNSKALSDLSSDSVTVSNTSSEPAYVELLGIFNTSGSDATPTNIILAFVGDISGGVPSGWAFVSATDGKQIKITKMTGEIGNTGGSNPHTHTGDHGHTHTPAHGHAIGSVTFTPAYYKGRRSGFVKVTRGNDDGHIHVWTNWSTVPTLQNTAVTMGTVDGRYHFRTVVWLKKTTGAGLTLTPTPAIFALSGISPALSLTLQLAPTAVALLSIAPVPVVVLGVLTLQPDVSVVSLAGPPITLDKQLALQPDPALLNVTASSTALDKRLTLQPVGVAIETSAPGVSVEIGALALQPATVTLETSAPEVSLELGALTLEPSAAAVQLDAPIPAIGLGTLTINAEPVALLLGPPASLLDLQLALSLNPAVMQIASQDVLIDKLLALQPSPTILTILPKDMAIDLGALAIQPVPVALALQAQQIIVWSYRREMVLATLQLTPLVEAVLTMADEVVVTLDIRQELAVDVAMQQETNATLAVVQEDAETVGIQTQMEAVVER